MGWTTSRLRSLSRAQLCLSMICGACSDSPPTEGDSDVRDGNTAELDAGTDARKREQSDGALPPKRDATGSEPDTETCARVDARPRPKDSAVWFIINPLLLDGQLASEDNTNQSTNRDMLRELLFGAQGVVPALGSTIQFGLASHVVSGPFAGVSCPNGEFVPAQLNQTAALMAAYDRMLPYQGASWGSMDLIAKEIAKRTQPVRDTIVIIQNVDGDAGCDLFVSAPEQQRKAVEQLAKGGAHVSVVSLLYTPEAVDDYEQFNAAARTLGMQLAELGKGQSFASDQGAAIRKAIEDTVDDAVSCEVRLEGKVEAGAECQGQVQLGGETLKCNDPNGFRLLDESTLELGGDACTKLRADAKATLSASFPCDVFVPVY